jgi:hypothetical protein
MLGRPTDIAVRDVRFAIARRKPVHSPQGMQRAISTPTGESIQ